MRPKSVGVVVKSYGNEKKKEMHTTFAVARTHFGPAIQRAAPLKIDGRT